MMLFRTSYRISYTNLDVYPMQTTEASSPVLLLRVSLFHCRLFLFLCPFPISCLEPFPEVSLAKMSEEKHFEFFQWNLWHIP